jgi:dihydropteroate synthase
MNTIATKILLKPFCVLGILNVTPDSFSDGGKHNSLQMSLDHAMQLIANGADVVDVGGESTRPGAAAVSIQEECERVLPVIEALKKETSCIVSIDTTKADVARQALAAGASIVNDVSAGRFDNNMASVIAMAGCPVILMHSRSNPAAMQDNPWYADVVAEVKQELLASVDVFTRAGVCRSNIILDPGFGFAKRFEDNCELLSRIKELLSLGFPLCIGTSRKSFLGQITGDPVDKRMAASLASVAAAWYGGVRMFRVHDVKETVDVLKVLTEVGGSKTV